MLKLSSNFLNIGFVEGGGQEGDTLGGGQSRCKGKRRSQEPVTLTKTHHVLTPARGSADGDNPHPASRHSHVPFTNQE